MESISVTIRKQPVFSLYCRDKTTTSCDRAKGKGGQDAVFVQPQQTNSLAPSATACRFCSAHPVKGNTRQTAEPAFEQALGLGKRQRTCKQLPARVTV